MNPTSAFIAPPPPKFSSIHNLGPFPYAPAVEHNTDRLRSRRLPSCTRPHQPVSQDGRIFPEGLENPGQHQFEGDVRGRGLFAGIEFVQDKKTKEPFDPKRKLNAGIGNRAFEKGLITYPGGRSADGIRGDHILLAPPLIITQEQIDERVRILDQTFTEVEREIAK